MINFLFFIFFFRIKLENFSKKKCRMKDDLYFFKIDSAFLKVQIFCLYKKKFLGFTIIVATK